jgi:hypothetical protein
LVGGGHGMPLSAKKFSGGSRNVLIQVYVRHVPLTQGSFVLGKTCID